MDKKPMFACFFLEVENVINNLDGSWILTYKTIGGKDDGVTNIAQFDSRFAFPSGTPIDILIPGEYYVIRYKIHNGKLTYESAFEVEIIKEIN